MIRLEHITKIYQSKKGMKTIALSDISLDFESKGFTIITGKSGSGKSTLLNIIGGLDKYDSGNIIILNKNSKDFTQEDFDSYRNTYVGFVFQEFNILEDYNVYENIIMALQLQQQKIDDSKIEEILKKLELVNLKYRKVNELSGGQKQRVAIARALIKNPSIILADEPTGNLDSTTGKQVMDLLKEISKEKLVIVVSHDIELANMYGDRIIEIKDGKVAKDTNPIKMIEMSNINYETIRSKLPLKESLKLGLQSLKCKKIKLVFTILLIIFTLLFLSISDTLSSYNVEKAHAHLLVQNKEKFVQIEKYNFSDINYIDYSNRFRTKLGEDDIAFINKNLQKEGNYIYGLTGENSTIYLDLYQLLKIKMEYGSSYDAYKYRWNEIDIVEINDFNSFFEEDIIGNFPTAYDEILISNYLADLIITDGIIPYIENDETIISSYYQPKDYEELVNSDKYFYFGERCKVKIVGIINYDLSKYQSLKGKSWEDLSKKERENKDELNHKMKNIFNKIYVNSEFIKKMFTVYSNILNNNYQYKLEVDNETLRNDIYMNISLLTDEIEYFNGTQWIKTDNLSENEMIFDIKQLSFFDAELYNQQLDNYLKQHKEKNRKEAEKDFFELYVSNFHCIGKTASLEIKDNILREVYKDIKVIGIVNSLENSHYFSLNLFDKYKISPVQKVGILVTENTQKGFEKIMRKFKYNQVISTRSSYSDDVHSLIDTIFTLRNIAFYISIVFLIFTVFLISNFMFSSIHHRKKEIGILRALGARSLDVVKIFVWEGIVIAIISGTLSSVLLIFITRLMNNIIMSGMDVIITPFIVGIRQFVVIYFVVLIVVLVSSIIPIMKISKMKPIDAILNK